MIETLKALYGDGLMVREGKTYPVYTFAPAPGDTLETVLAPDVPRTLIDDFAVYDVAHLAALQASRPHLTNGLCYVLDAITLHPLQLKAKLGYYYDMLATCDALDHELRRYTRGEQTSLPMRETFHAALPPSQVMVNGAGRSAVVGVAVLTVFKHEGAYKCIVAQRSQSVATGAGLFHVLPAFVFQPSGPEAFYQTEWSVTHQIYREFGEELFGMPEYKDETSPDYFFEHPGVGDLRQMVETEQAEMHLTCLAFNPLSTRPEVCALVMIHDEGWYPRWEAQLQAALDTERQQTFYIPIDTLDGLPEDLNTRMAPHGAAALWFGVEKARRL